ncbi:hypothetical protein BpHYR1_045980 [Brachionus plicatilis]|uniref:Uncharacterized protein n=1 Tax=Brachionus plicatilis TaxID=10195 RepID=A0A3M7T6Q1_BRAPC|nr:hypothetical protein BpHYR1_045980 [Brachionus plicatilis]
MNIFARVKISVGWRSQVEYQTQSKIIHLQLDLLLVRFSSRNSGLDLRLVSEQGLMLVLTAMFKFVKVPLHLIKEKCDCIVRESK